MLIMCVSLYACRKLLTEKSDKRLAVPSKLKDLQALLDYSATINNNMVTSGDRSGDDYYITDAAYKGLPAVYLRNLYTWQGRQLFSDEENDWYFTYQAIYYPTSVLARLDEIGRTPQNAAEWDHLKGQALTLRAYRYLSAVTLWAKAYDEATASTDLGIPLRQTDDFSQPSVRASVAQTYEDIVQSLKTAIPLLPDRPVGISRAGKQMAFGLLARTYLFMRRYADAGKYADSALLINKTLLDFNTLSNNVFPDARLNPEIVFYATGNTDYGAELLDPEMGRVDSLLYRTFNNNDLRKRVFFQANLDGSQGFAGNYTASPNTRFYGICNAEIYLMRAECEARTGDPVKAMAFLNDLLIKRFDKSKPYIPLTAANNTEALALVLRERRKEMMFRAVRWPDIKRLNKEGANIVLKRVIDGTPYTLAPNDNRYALAIPEDIILLSGMPQNPQ